VFEFGHKFREPFFKKLARPLTAEASTAVLYSEILNVLNDYQETSNSLRSTIL